MPGWEEALNELNQEQARQKRYEELVEDAAYRLVRALDLRINEFVQTLHDHDQWPVVNKQVTEKERSVRGLLFQRVEWKTVTKTVTGPSYSIDIDEHIASTHGPLGDNYRLSIRSNREWSISRFFEGDWSTPGRNDLVVAQTAEGMRVGHSSQLVTNYGVMQPTFDLAALSSAYIKQMASYLIQRGLPLPQD